MHLNLLELEHKQIPSVKHRLTKTNLKLTSFQKSEYTKTQSRWDIKSSRWIDPILLKVQNTILAPYLNDWSKITGGQTGAQRKHYNTQEKNAIGQGMVVDNNRDIPFLWMASSERTECANMCMSETHI